MGHSSGNMEDCGTEGDSICGGLVHAVSEENICISPRDHSRDLFCKNMVAFHPYLNYLPETKVKSFRIILLALEISKIA